MADCFECKVAGTTCAALTGFWALYSSNAPYYLKNPRHKIFMYGLAGGCFYISFARWNLHPPFSSLRNDTEYKNEVKRAFDRPTK